MSSYLSQQAVRATITEQIRVAQQRGLARRVRRARHSARA